MKGPNKLPSPVSPGPQVWGWARLPIPKTDWYTGDGYNPGSPHLCFKAKATPLPAALLCVLSHLVTSPQSNYIPTDTVSPVPRPLWDAKLQTLGSSPSQGKPSFMAELQAWRFNSSCWRFLFQEGSEKGCCSHPPATPGPQRQETLVNAGSRVLTASCHKTDL